MGHFTHTARGAGRQESNREGRVQGEADAVPASSAVLTADAAQPSEEVTEEATEESAEASVGALFPGTGSYAIGVDIPLGGFQAQGEPVGLPCGAVCHKVTQVPTQVCGYQGFCSAGVRTGVTFSPRRPARSAKSNPC